MENKSHAFLAGLFAILLGVAMLLALYWLGGDKEKTAKALKISLATLYRKLPDPVE